VIKICEGVESLCFIEISYQEFLNNFSIEDFPIPPKKICVFIKLPKIRLNENSELFCFLSQRLAQGFEMCGLIFRKHDYYISLALTDKGWVLYKNSGKVRFKNWAEGCAAAYEMGMVLHIVVYVKSHFPLSTPEN
jgi:hypothetical protein